MSEAKKSLDDLRQDVERYQHRLELKAAAAALPALEAERRRLDEQIAAADQQLEAAEDHHEETTQPLYLRRREVDQAISAGANARMQLVHLCPDSELRRELEEIDIESRRAVETRRALGDRASRLERDAQYEREVAEHELVITDGNHHRDQAARLEKEAEALRREAKKAEKMMTDLAKRREKLEERMRQA